VGQREALANAFILYTPFVVGVVVAIFIANAWAAPLGFAWFTLALYALGLALFLAAKFSLVRRGIRFSFGSAHMSRGSQLAYRIGYALMILGLFAAFSLLVALRAGPSG